MLRDFSTLANKIDLRRQVKKEEGQQLATQLDVGYIETSAKTKENVLEALQRLCTIILSKRDDPSSRNREGGSEGGFDIPNPDGHNKGRNSGNNTSNTSCLNSCSIS